MRIHDENDGEAVVIDQQSARMVELIKNNRSTQHLKQIKECFNRFKDQMERTGTYVPPKSASQKEQEQAQKIKELEEQLKYMKMQLN